MKTLVLIALSCGLSCLPGQAAPVTYNVHFTLDRGTQLPASASFTYDPNSGFSDFLVVWNSLTFDLTPEANAPQVVPPTGCQGEASNYQFGFILMSQSAAGCTPQYFWQGEDDSLEEFFSFALLTNTDPLTGAAISENLSISTGHDHLGIGGWTLTAVPEPGTWTGVAIAGLLLARRRVGRRFFSSRWARG